MSPTSLGDIEALEESFSESYKEDRLGIWQDSVDYGQTVGHAILAWADGDGFSTYGTWPYVSLPLAGAWVPTPPGFSPNPLEPGWGQLRPMALTSGAEAPPDGHPRVSTDAASSFFDAAHEVYGVGLALTSEQKTIAGFWADNAGVTGTPPGHWIAIVSQIARNDGLSLAAAAEAYVRVGIAVHDAFIQCWRNKYLYNLERPVTYIRKNIDAGWLPYLATPNFPSYTSGHSTQSGAAATVLTDMFGQKAFTDTTHRDHGLVPPLAPRRFASFEQAAAEAALSRLYAGIHYAFDNNDGFACGQLIGAAVLQRIRFERPERRVPLEEAEGLNGN